MVNEPAGFWIRFGATLLDAIIIGIPLAIVTSFIVGNVEENWLNNTLSFFVHLAYACILGRTYSRQIHLRY